jgi:hypothetical protein
VFKLQEAAALRVPNVTPETVEAMRPFAETVYLTQTIEKIDGKLNRYLNLDDAFAAYEANPNPKIKREWRTHVHVPVFLDKIGEHFETTRFAIEDALKFHRKNKQSPQLEIETYTWDVLPASMKGGDIVDYVQRELDWVMGQLVWLAVRRRTQMKVGFIGLGRMGQAMAARVQGGHELVVYNRTRAKCADLEKAGAKVAGSMVEACRGRRRDQHGDRRQGARES